MSVMNDKILRGGEITSTGKQMLFEARAYYLMLVPKSDESPAIAILNVRLSQEVDYKDFPFPIGQWNPTKEHTENYMLCDLLPHCRFR